MTAAEWYLGAGERGNPATTLDSRHPDGRAWTEGNRVVPLVHGSAYFAELHGRVSAMRGGDLLLFVDWRGDPDERLLGEPGSEIARVLARAAERGVDVRGLIWRSHLDRLQFSAKENRHLGEDVNAAGGQCELDMRVRPGGSHHQKFLVLRHPGRPELDVAFVGGIDLCHTRRDDADHHGDPQRQPMAGVYGDRPPWHDAQLMVTGPAVGDGPGPTTPSCPRRCATATTPARCVGPLRASTSTAAPVRSSTRRRCSTPSPRRRPGSRRGTTGAAWGPGRRAGCGRSRSRRWAGSPACGPARCTAPSTTRTAGRCS